MSSVAKRIDEIKQPRGGYVKPSQFELRTVNDGNILNESENVSASIIGMAVDYLTRYAMGADLMNAFHISCIGAKRAEEMFGQKNAMRNVFQLLTEINTIDEKAIINACKLVTYDIWLRNPAAAMMVKGENEINPDKITVQNIEIMIERSLKFWEDYGPIVKDGFTFEPGGYTATVDSGDGDYLTTDTLWDYKVSKSKPTSKHTLQLLMYWIMGQHSGQSIFKGIDKIGIFNPRRNEVYSLNIDTISPKIIDEIERDIICY